MWSGCCCSYWYTGCSWKSIQKRRCRLASPFLCRASDQAEFETDQQQDEKCDGQRDTDGQCFCGAFSLPLVFHQEKQGGEQAGQYQRQHGKNEYLDRKSVV